MEKEEGYQDCYVAFLDILGFKNIILSKSVNNFDQVNEIFELLIRIRNEIIHENNSVEADYDFSKTVEETMIRISSDSVVIATPAIFKNSLSFITECCRRYQSELLKKEILIRGAITKGDFYLNKEKMFGKALVDAYVYEENDAKYPRIILNKKIVNEYLEIVETSTVIYLTDFIVKDKDEYYFINYLSYYLENSDDFIRLNIFINEKLSSPEIRGDVREKYIWLKNYYNSVIREGEYHNVYNIDPKHMIDDDVTKGV